MEMIVLLNLQIMLQISCNKSGHLFLKISFNEFLYPITTRVMSDVMEMIVFYVVHTYLQIMK